jgi:hypothetical protein
MPRLPPSSLHCCLCTSTCGCEHCSLLLTFFFPLERMKHMLPIGCDDVCNWLVNTCVASLSLCSIVLLPLYELVYFGEMLTLVFAFANARDTRYGPAQC